MQLENKCLSLWMSTNYGMKLSSKQKLIQLLEWHRSVKYQQSLLM